MEAAHSEEYAPLLRANCGLPRTDGAGLQSGASTLQPSMLLAVMIIFLSKVKNVSHCWLFAK